MFAFVELRALAGDGFEILVEAGEVVEAAFVAQPLDADPVVEEQLAGVAYPDLGEELSEGLSGTGFKITTEGVRYETGDGGYFFEIDLPGKMAKGEIVDGVDAVILSFGEIGAKAYRRQQLQPVGGSEGRQAFDEGDDAADAFRGVDVVDEPGDAFIFSCADEDAAPGFFEEASDGFGLRQVEEGVAPKILGKVNDGGMHGPIAVTAEIYVIVAPIMWEVAAHKNDITGLEPLDVIADELRAVALVEDNELHFRVVVPAVIDKRVPVLPYAEGMGGGPWYLEEFRLHADCKGKTDEFDRRPEQEAVHFC